MESSEITPQANIGTSQEIQVLNNSYPVSGLKADGNSKIPGIGTNNVRLKCRLQEAGYIGNID